MPDSRKYLPPEAVKRVARLELRARQIVEGFLSGSHRSPYFGQSIEFVQHRQYVAGDDVRHVDWKVWARQDKLVIKQYEEDTNLRCALLVDSSASMRYGRGALNKFDYACTLAACIAYLVLRQQDAVGSVMFDNRIRSRLPYRTARNHLNAILASLEDTKPAEKTDLDSIFKGIVEIFPKRGLMVLISDLLGAEESTLRGIDSLRRAGHDVMVLHVLDDDELDFPFADPTRFEGLETSDTLTCNPRALREGYLEALERFLDRVRRACAASKSDYLLIRPSQSPDAVLAKILNQRMQSMRQH
ncbi:MAG: DUF58 domain-containing protein [Pirellulaceae bacterium]|nr:DUF58 domain-containing protein [Pirellulaceae bacterium]